MSHAARDAAGAVAQFAEVLQKVYVCLQHEFSWRIWMIQLIFLPQVASDCGCSPQATLDRMREYGIRGSAVTYGTIVKASCVLTLGVCYRVVFIHNFVWSTFCTVFLGGYEEPHAQRNL